MEIRTCEEYVLAELDRLTEENANLLATIDDMRAEHAEAIADVAAQRDRYEELYTSMALHANRLREKNEETEAKLEAVIRELNELKRLSAPNFEPVREVRDGDAG